MEQSKSLRRKKTKVSKIKIKSEKHIHEYIDKKLDELGWDMGEKYSYREDLHDRQTICKID